MTENLSTSTLVLQPTSLSHIFSSHSVSHAIAWSLYCIDDLRILQGSSEEIRMTDFIGKFNMVSWLYADNVVAPIWAASTVELDCEPDWPCPLKFAYLFC